MTTFDDRERSFEKKFVMDQELAFRAQARSHKMIGQWAAAKLGLVGPAAEDYVKEVRKADMVEKGTEDIFRKLRKDFDDKHVAISDTELRKVIADSLSSAMAQIQAEGKSQ